MNQLHTDRSSFGSWGPTAVAGAVSTTAVALLLSAVVSTPAYSAPSHRTPLGGTTAVTVDRHAADATPYCFMGRPQWHDMTAARPSCRR